MSLRFAKIVTLAAATLATALLAVRADEVPVSSSPEPVLRQFLKAIYSRDARTAYGLLSIDDRQVKTLEDYVAETAAFEGRSLNLANALAEGIQLLNLRSEVKGTRATITFDAVLPDANAPSVDNIVRSFDGTRLAHLSKEEMASLEAEIRSKVRATELPVLRSMNESWDLVHENDSWRVFQNWAEAVEVTFDAFTFQELGWEFTPVRDSVMAKHGETIKMAYRAKNIGESETTGKARHIIGPDREAQYLEIIECFCFLEQTLAPGEEVELPLVFRVDYEAPESLKKFDVRYEFYPFHKFPDGRDLEARVQETQK